MKELIERIENEIAFEKAYGNVLDEASWGNKTGILMSVNDADKIVKLAIATESLLFMMGKRGFNPHGAKTLDDSISMAKVLYDKVKHVQV